MEQWIMISYVLGVWSCTIACIDHSIRQKSSIALKPAHNPETAAFILICTYLTLTYAEFNIASKISSATKIIHDAAL